LFCVLLLCVLEVVLLCFQLTLQDNSQCCESRGGTEGGKEDLELRLLSLQLRNFIGLVEVDRLRDEWS
jgi:hypothetical protein